MTTDIIYRYKNQVYFNITNKCPCRCTFCIRNTEDAIGEASNLWFEHEPALEEIYKAIDEFDFSDCNEVVFCGGDAFREVVQGVIQTLTDFFCSRTFVDQIR